MKTVILDARANQSEAVTRAVEVLRKGELVALPTETVYGLAGDALDSKVVAKIFEAKNRPSFDPLIVHVGSKDWLARLARSIENEPIVRQLIERFWPGPLTILFRKSDRVPDLVTAGLDAVAIRMPNNPIFLAVLRAFGKPLAAPSANRFGRVSPTQAAHALEELARRIPLILDGGPTELGVESTIVRVSPGQIEILRPGPVTEQDLALVAAIKESGGSQKIIAPGQTQSHYAPERPVYLFDLNTIGPAWRNYGLICWGPVHHVREFALVRSLSETRDLRVAAQRLFSLLREMDRPEIEGIVVEPVPEHGLGKAIMNRIRRATAPRETGA
ncbi:MAG: threonylcarbamoyl-AMP synthase [Verrucomicrobia bacterium]|nr:threonylcarbamoyl-AMP synthase [Verrucomicrobiota bacterium]